MVGRMLRGLDLRDILEVKLTGFGNGLDMTPGLQGLYLNFNHFYSLLQEPIEADTGIAPKLPQTTFHLCSPVVPNSQPY